MKRHAFALRALAALALVALAAGAATAATPSPNSAVIKTRIFNDCPSSIVSTFNGYPGTIEITDSDLSCFGFANLHNWRFSEDGVGPAIFDNNSEFKFSATLVISGSGDGESGLQISPWWSPDVDGRLNVRTTDGEIACFGGRLPFYSFSGAPHLLRYVKGTPIGLEIKYHPHSLSKGDPATIEYIVTYGGSPYSSGVLPFDEGNPSEPYGTWGMLDDAQVGAHLQVFMTPGTPSSVTASWLDISFNAGPTATENRTWGSVKTIYR